MDQNSHQRLQRKRKQHSDNDDDMPSRENKRMDQNSHQRLQRKRKQHSDNDDDMPSREGINRKDFAQNFQVQQRKRKQISDDGEEVDVFKYRKLRKETDDYNSEKSESPRSSAEEQSDKESSGEDGWSSWGSSESDEEKHSDQITTENGEVAKEEKEREKYEELCKEEETVVGTLEAYWTGYVMRKLRQEIPKETTNIDNTTKVTELQCFAAKKLTGLPLVVSVGVEKNKGQINVYVSNKEKAMELSEELRYPNINVIEAHCTQFI